MSENYSSFFVTPKSTPAFSSFVIAGQVKGISEEKTTDSEPEQETRFVEEDMKSVESQVEQSSAQGEDTKAP